jgi:uncharacterized protein (DUF433 family)
MLGDRLQEYLTRWMVLSAKNRPITEFMTMFDRITFDPLTMGGRPCIRGMRVTVGMIVGMIAANRSVDEILRLYPYLQREDVVQALEFAAWRSEEREVVLPIA